MLGFGAISQFAISQVVSDTPPVIGPLVTGWSPGMIEPLFRPARRFLFEAPPIMVPVGNLPTTVGIAGQAWSQRFEEFKGRPRFTDPPAFALPDVPAVGISGIPWSQRFEPFYGKKGQSDPEPPNLLAFIPAVGVSGIPWSQRQDFVTPRKGTTDPNAFAHTGLPAVGVSGVSWSLRLDYVFPKKGSTDPEAYDPRLVPAIIPIAGQAWSQRFEPFYGRATIAQHPAHFFKAPPPVGISGMAWFTDHDTWRSLRPFDFTSPIGATFTPIWIVAPPAEFTGERRPLYHRGISYWKGRS